MHARFIRKEATEIHGRLSQGLSNAGIEVNVYVQGPPELTSLPAILRAVSMSGDD